MATEIQPLENILPPLLKEGIVVFCGAGISIPPPSCSPSWWTLTEEILKAFFDRVPEDYNLPKDMIIKDPERTPEEVFEAFSNILDERMYKAFEVLNVAEPNANHYALARLAKKGILKACFTTNFDIYLEKALKEEGVDFKLLVENIEYEKYFETHIRNIETNHKFILCKVHGTIERPNTIVSVASAYKSAKGFSAPKGNVFKKLIETYPCVFLGYSGWDFNHLNYRRFWKRVGPSVKKIIWNNRPGKRENIDFSDIFQSCWGIFEFTQAELPNGLIKAIEKIPELKIDIEDLTMDLIKDDASNYAKAQAERIRFFNNWVGDFPESHMIGLVITESQKFSTTFREFMKHTKEYTQDTEAISYNISNKIQEITEKHNLGEISLEEYQHQIFTISLENAIKLIRKEYIPRIREIINNNEFPGITDNSSIVLMLLNALIATSRYFDIDKAIFKAVEYINNVQELNKLQTNESRAEQTILGFKLQLERPNRDDWKRYLDQMYLEKQEFISGEIDFNQFSSNCAKINQKAVNELVGMTVDIYELLDKQVEATIRSNSTDEFEDQAGALSITIMQIAAYLCSKFYNNQIYLDLLEALSQNNLPEHQRDPNKVIKKEMLDGIDKIIRDPFIPVLKIAEQESNLVSILMEMAILSIWIQTVQYLDPIGMKEYQRMWDAGEYPKRFSPKMIYNYLKEKIKPWLDNALENLPARYAQKLCGNLAIMGEMGDDLDLCKQATLRSLELSENMVTEATPENIPGNLAAFYERLGDSENALKYYMICLNGIKLRYPPVLADAIVYRTAVLLNEKGEKTKALEILGTFHPSFRGNASSVVLVSRKKGELLAEELARDLGYKDAHIAVNNVLG